jgi:hypothetical protein
MPDIYDSVYIDFDDDGSFATAGDDVSAYWQATRVRAGLRDVERKRVADVGTLDLTLNNEDKRFSPDYADGPYYGKFKPGLPIRVKAGNIGADGSTLFTGVIMSITPSIGTRGPFTCQIKAHDYMGVLQSTGISLPLQTDEDAETIAKKICALAFDGGVATASATFDDTVSDGDTITIGSVVYTFKTALTGDPYEILIASADGADNLESCSANLAKAINNEATEGTDYGNNTIPHLYVTASPTVGFGVTSEKRDTWVALRDIASGYDALSATWFFQLDDHTNQYTKLFMRKVGSPTGTMTITIEYSSGTAPSGTLIDASATTTIAESTLAAGGDWVIIDWGEALEYVPWRRFHLHLTTDRAASAVNYVELGMDNGADDFGGIRVNTGGTWTWEAGDPIVLWPSAIDLSANARGAFGNSLALSTTGSNITVSGAVFSGGSDAPSGYQDFTAGELTFPIAADEWTEDRTNGLTAFGDLAQSAWGYAYAARDGSLTFKPYTFELEQLATATSLDLTGQPNRMDATQSLDNIVNEVIVEYIPRRQGSTGVIARANGPIRLPARSGTARYDPTSAPGETTTTISYIEGETGNVVGATEVITPVSGTDFTIRTGPESTVETKAGETLVVPILDITSRNKVSVTVAKSGGCLQATFINKANITLYVHDFQVRGTALIAYDKQRIAARDTTSIAAYGRRTRTIRLPLPSDERFARGIAEWVLYLSKNLRTVVDSVTFTNQRTVGTVSLYDVDLMSTISLTETQTGISDQKYLITGWDCQRSVEGSHSLTWHVVRLNHTPTCILDDETYAVLDSTTILGL